MAKLLVLCTRLFLCFLGASFLLALAVSSLRESRSMSLPLGAARWDTISSLSWPNHWEDQARCYLIDRESSRCDLVPLPSGNRWDQLSVSPWCDEEGNTEAVCQSDRFPAVGGGQSFWGLARLRLPEGDVIDEVRLELLPTGRPCWVPANTVRHEI